MYNYQDVQYIARNERRDIRNNLIYLIPKKEYVICSNFTQKGGDVDWDWGHYYNDFKSAVIDFYKQDLFTDYYLDFNIDVLKDLKYNDSLSETEQLTINAILQFIEDIGNNKERYRRG